MIDPKILHYYRKTRKHQIDTYGPDYHRVFSGGGAVPGFHAMAAYQSARRHIHFLQRLTRYVTQTKNGVRK